MTRSYYPWDTWLDGDEWVLVQGQDFDVHPHTIRTSARTAAIRRGGVVYTRITGGRVITLQFLPNRLHPPTHN